MIINNENCLHIIGFERYHISESGRIYRTDVGKKRSKKTKDKLFLSENKIHFRVKNDKLQDGYASLTDNKGKLHSVNVAVLVATYFGHLSKKFNVRKQVIAYKDGNKRNLHYSNLTVAEKENVNCKLTIEDVKQIKKHIRRGVPLNRLARLFGVSEMQINRIKTGENWGSGKRKIKKPEAPFKIKDGKMRRYIATFNHKKTESNIRKTFTIRRNPENPTENTIVGIVNGYRLSINHKNITRAREIVKKLNEYFFEYKLEKEVEESNSFW